MGIHSLQTVWVIPCKPVPSDLGFCFPLLVRAVSWKISSLTSLTLSWRWLTFLYSTYSFLGSSEINGQEQNRIQVHITLFIVRQSLRPEWMADGAGVPDCSLGTHSVLSSFSPTAQSILESDNEKWGPGGGAGTTPSSPSWSLQNHGNSIASNGGDENLPFIS